MTVQAPSRPEDVEKVMQLAGSLLRSPEARSKRLRGAKGVKGAKVAHAARRLQEGGLVGLQLGGLLNTVESIASPVAETGLRGLQKFFELPGVKQVSQGLEWEQRKIGRPVTQALLMPFSPILPDAVERGLVSVGSAFFTPSSAAFFLIPFGRAATAGRLLAGRGALAATGEITGAQAASQSRMVLRQLFAPSTRQAAQVIVSKRVGIPVPEFIRQTIQNPRLADEVFSVEKQMKSLRRMTPSRWSKVQKQIGKDDMDFVDGLLFSDIKPGTPVTQAKTHFENHAWWRNLLRDDAIDPSQLTDSVGLFARTWNTFKNVPFLGPALEGTTHVLQPIAMMSAPVRRTWLTAASHAPGFNWQAQSARDQIGMILEAAFNKQAVEGASAGLKYVGPASRAKDPALKQVVGKLIDVIEHPRMYELSTYQKNSIKRVQRVFNLDRAEAASVGVNIGQVNSGYIPHRISVEAMNPNAAARLTDFFARQSQSPRFSPMFRRRRYKWDEFVQRADEIAKMAEAEGFTLLGSGVETSIVKLADWRLGNSARKKAEQLFYHLLARQPETKNLVFRPARLGPKLKEALTKEGFPFEHVAEEFAEVGKPQLKRAAGRRIQVTSKELSLRPAESLSGVEREFARDARALMEGSLRREEGVEGIASRGLDFMRSVLLSADISPIGMVQGIRSFSADPFSWFAQIGEASAWMGTKHGKKLWALQNLPNVQYWTRRGLTLGNVLDIRPEMLEKWTVNVFGKKVPTPLAIMGWSNRQMMDMVQVAKLRNANTMLSAIALSQRSPETAELLTGLPWFERFKKSKGSGWAGSSYDEIADAISDGLNNAIGPINFNLVNKQGMASLGERFMILTPSWTRGNIGQIVNAAKLGTPKGVVARWLLMNQLGTGAFLASKISMAFTGEMPSFDPKANDFLSVKMPWGRFNILPSMPAYRLPVRLIAGRPDADALEGRWSEFLRFGETRMGQVPRITVDLIQGEDFLGRRIDNKALFLTKELLPIIGQEVVETRQEGGVPDTDLAQRLALELSGTVVIPKTPFSLERDRVEELTGKPYDEAGTAELRRLRASDPVMRTLRQRQTAYRAERGGPLNQFFNLLEERTKEMQAAVRAFLNATPVDSPGFMAKFAAISSEELSSRAVAAEEAKRALGIKEGDITSAPKKVKRDALAIEYWTVRPELTHCRIAQDQDACEDDAWTTFREHRQAVLDQADSDEMRRYMVEEFAATRYAGNPVAEDLERRRVLAQMSASDFFETSPYILPTGEPMPDEMLDEVFGFRGEFNNLMVQLGRLLRQESKEEDFKMPSGSRRNILTALLSAAETPLRKAAISFQILWESSKAREFLRNPRRDDILLANPDMIKFFPDTFARFVRRNEVIDALGSDPEIVRIAAGQSG